MNQLIGSVNLKGPSTNFTHQDPFTHHGVHYSVYENGCVMFSLVLEDNNTIHVIQEMLCTMF